MIKQETSRTGLPVLRIDGRLIASSIDPMREAVTWAKNAAEQAKDGSIICVIGAGCGYHIQELKRLRLNSRILVIEKSQCVVDWVLTQFPQFKKEMFLVGENPVDALERWSEALFAVGPVLVHGPTAQLYPEWTHQIARFVLARDRTMFLTQIRARPELLAILDPEKIEHMPDDLVSIKTIGHLFKQENSDSQERRLWRVLEELIS